MTTRMLIDARHREETRVAVVKGNRIEEFDFESAERKQLKGNIYLAKVTRVEPSLQAAFIDYGGNRHGFLAFSEIHPDYYQIPKEDREALLREEAEHAAEEAALRAEHDDEDDAEGDADVDADDAMTPEGDEAEPVEGTSKKPRGDDQVEALRQRRQNLRRRYKIQDVIRRRQVLLVQVVKEERGNKGAALTTYLSLAGRYCVLMPNTSHGGGISRKISSAADRKRLKSIMAELTLPASMGCIVRTAGLQRTKVEIKRDFDYLARLWDGIRETTLSSAAPALIYGDSDLVKRAIRDIYNRDIDEVIVEGEDGYLHAREFMKLLMPSHARKVKQYADAVPLFQRAHVEDQLAAMYNPVVQLKSGGYLVINPTEALVSIDINSGRSTREHNIEQTATATNLEAAGEIARQLRLRDMAGLVVIDFIDMDNGSNVRKVEKAMKEALKDDRARIQVGRISQFGLMEMSRQRLRTGVLEASTRVCPHCEGTGLVRTAASAGLSALRLVEDEAARGRGSVLTLRASQEAAIYVLNKKRADIAEIEDRYGVSVEILPDREEEGARMSVEASGPPPAHAPKFEALPEEIEDDLPDEMEIDEEDEELDAAEAAEAAAPEQRDGEGKGRRRRRRGRGRGRGRGREEGASEADSLDAGESDGTSDDEADDLAEADLLAAEGSLPAEDNADQSDAGAQPEAIADEGTGRGRSRRGRRGGRGRRNAAAETLSDEAPTSDAEATAEPVDAGDVGPVTSPLDLAAADAPADAATVNAEPLPVATETDAAIEPAPKTRRRPRARVSEPDAATAEPAAPDAAMAEPEAPKPRRSRKAAPTADQVDGEAAPKPARAPRRRAKPSEAAAPVDETSVLTAGGSAGAGMADDERAVADAGDEGVIADAGDEGASGGVATLLVGQDGTAAANDTAAPPETAPEAAEPPRRGWWQRTFGA